MDKKHTLNFAIFIDIESRDGSICRTISKELQKLGYTSSCFSLKDEKDAYQKYLVEIAIINKPHFLIPFRLKQKLKGTKYIVLDTEGILPGDNRQHVLLEPEGYVHWFQHQAQRYNFKTTETVVVGYTRLPFLVRVKNSKKGLISVATNFSILGYSKKETLNRQKDRKLKLFNDWSLVEYQSFQQKSLIILNNILKENPEKKFVLKPHPNDPKNLWHEVNLPPNVEVLSGNCSIDKLFETNPVLHLCMDGCTTILDAFISGIPVATFGKFNPLKNSLLRNLLAGELNGSTDIDALSNEYKINDFKVISNTKNNQKLNDFRTELFDFNLNKIVDLALQIKSGRARFKLYDIPTSYHFYFWIKIFLKYILRVNVQKSKRVKFHE